MIGLRPTSGAMALGVLFALGCTSVADSAWDEPDDTAAAAPSEGSEARYGELVAAGDASWQNRDDAAAVRETITAWEEAVQIAPQDHTTWAKLSRAYYFLADGHVRFTDDDETMELHQRGIRAAERALRVLSPEFGERMAAGERFENVIGLLDAEAVPALYWRASNLGRWARAQGFATTISYKDEIRAIMGHCLTENRYFFFAGPDRYFGAFYAIAPAYAGGDMERSEAHFQESLRQQPDYLGTRVLYAELFAVKAQNRQLFQEQLEIVIAADADALAPVAPENRAEQRKAQELLGQIDDLFE